MPDDSKKRSSVMQPIIDKVAATEFEPVEGVTADALDVVETKSLARQVLLKAYSANKAAKELAAEAAEKLARGLSQASRLFPNLAEDIAAQVPRATVRITPTVTPTITPASRFLKLLKKLPPVQALTMSYEAAALMSSKEQREKAWEQTQAMGERGYSSDDVGQSLQNALKNGAQGYLDPVGTIYGAGRGLKELFADDSKALKARLRKK